MTSFKAISLVMMTGLALAACDSEEDDWGFDDEETRAKPIQTDARNLHLESVIRFHRIPVDGDPDRGRQLFGLAEDMETEDTTNALFSGFSTLAGEHIESNGRTCFTCHRGVSTGLGIPRGPLDKVIPLTDPLFTGIDADAQRHPDAFDNLNNFGLILYRPHRFDPRKNPKDGSREAIGWRKSVRMINTGFQMAFLTDSRIRTANNTDFGAVFSHTQEGNKPFPDLLDKPGFDVAADFAAFMLTAIVEPPELEYLRDPSHPEYQKLISDPYYTVNIQTAQEQRGRDVFHQNCFGCHNLPNVFSSIENVEAQPNGRPGTHSPWAPSITVTYNVGVSARNKHKLRFDSLDQETGELKPVVLRLVREDGSIVHHKVTTDLGLAMTTLRVADMEHFKVPQLRGLRNNGPYFHDNSADTIEEVVDFFTGSFYKNSPAGQTFPIKLTAKQKEDLIAFLYIL